MMIQGFLFQLNECELGRSFKLVCDSATINLSSSRVEETRNSDKKIEIYDKATKVLLDVAAPNRIVLQESTVSALWISSNYGAILDSDSNFDANRTSPRICSCFRFRSGTEFNIFAKLLSTYQRVQQYQMLVSSSLTEIEMENEHCNGLLKMKRHTKKTLSHLKDNPSLNEEVLFAHNPPSDDTSSIFPHSTNFLVHDFPVVKLCILCDRKSSVSSALTKHPFVLQDGAGESINICKRCLQEVMNRFNNSFNAEKTRKSSGSVSLCGLCMKTSSRSKRNMKRCSHPQCPRMYCLPCLEKLLGLHASSVAWQQSNWNCTNCTVVTRDLNNNLGNNSTRDTIDEGITSKTMSALEYCVNYWEFLLAREDQPSPPTDSEDVCFCCKDGGELLECDWKGLMKAGLKCPKVYHEDCLGYKVPEDAKWNCPRHRCVKCGIIAKYSCRYCVTSYCDKHLFAEVKRLGSGSQDISPSLYIICLQCDRQIKDAISAGKVSDEFYSCLLGSGKKE